MNNWKLPELTDKHIVFVGKDRESESFDRFIRENVRVSSYQTIFIDEDDSQGHRKKLAELDHNNVTVVKTAGYPGSLMPCPYTTPTKIFFECVKQLGAEVIGITGTKGKSTTTMLIGAMLKNTGFDARVCGNIGIPMIDTLEGATKDTKLVVELSSYQLAELETSPHISVITNLYRDHIDYHGSLALYWEAKRNIMRHMTDSDTLVFSPDYDIIFHWLAESKCQQIIIDTSEEVDMSKTALIGDHNIQNILLAKVVAKLYNVTSGVIQTTIDEFKPLPHRIEPIRTVRGVIYVDDAIGSQPEATIAAITSLIRKVGPIGCLMIGGKDRDYDFSELAKLIYRIGIPKLVLFPDTGKKVVELLPESFKPEIFETSSMEEAVAWAGENTPSGSVCLLSTGAPSYSLWKDYEEKGDLFQKAVNKLSN